MSDTEGKLSFDVSQEPSKHHSYGDLVLSGKIMARDIHRDHAIDICRRWNSHKALVEACEHTYSFLISVHDLDDKEALNWRDAVKEEIEAALAQPK